MAGRFQFPYPSVFDANGNPLSGAKLNFYQSGTSTPLNTFSDAALTIPNTNPVVADSAGRFSDIFLGDGPYKVVLTTSANVVQWTADPVYAPSSTGAVGQNELPTVGGTGNAITLTYTRPPVAYTTGLRATFKATTPNTGATTVNINGLGAKNVFMGLAALGGGEIANGAIHEMEYDGTQFQLLNPSYAQVIWAPTDQSGAGLSISVSDAYSVKIGRIVMLVFSITYPVTADATAAKLSLPVVPKNLAGVDQIYTIVGAANAVGIVAKLNNAGVATMQIASATNIATLQTNANLSGQTISGCFTYMSA